ncbi:MAG: phytanoyl-CoA dioxygenase family protein [Candidatus Poribacteria bacterium]|nr:phytanoyl-CoA dioxygenase family protein [Candidatus Poribacteria bacterium]
MTTVPEPITNAMPELERALSFHPVRNPSPKSLTPEQIAYFNEKGYLSPLDVFTASEAAANRAYFDDLMARAEANGWNDYAINGWHRHCQGVYDLVVEPRILDMVQDLLGSNLICWGTHFFSKKPGDDARVSWHQDASYWPLTPSKTVTVWLAIDDADVENSAMRVVPGSHRHGQIGFHRSASDEKNVLNQTVIDAERYGDPPVSLEMRAGQMSLHSDLLLHGSEPNRSSRRRCGLTMRFLDPEVRAYHGWNRNAITARGVDPADHWGNVARPVGENVPPRESN